MPDFAAAGPVSPEQSEAVDRLFLPVSRSGGPGCAAAVYREGRIVYSKGFGEANVEFGIPVRPDTVFNAGSMAKQFTAFAVLLLAEEGRIDLDQDVGLYLPTLPDYRPRYARPVTVRQLLQHTGGVRDFDVLRQLAGAHADDVFEQDSALRLIGRQSALNFEPGSRWAYSNSGYVLAAEIVRRVSGKPLPDFLQERVFGPLGMRDTRIARSHDEFVPRRASGYAKDGGSLRLWMPNGYTLGDGALFTTVADLARWDSNLDSPVIGARAVERMMEPGKLTSGRPLDYGMGLFVGSLRGQRIVYDPGSFGGYFGNYLRIPALRLGIGILCNSRAVEPVSLSRRIAAAILGDRLPPAVAASPPEAAAEPLPAANLSPRALAGTYGDAASNLRLSFEIAGGALVLREDGQTVPVRPGPGGTFVAGAGESARRFRFESGAASAPAVAELLSDDPGDEVRLSRLPAPPAGAELRRHLGSYYSRDLDARYTIVMDKGALAARWPNGNLTPLVPFQRGQFGRNGIVFTFSNRGFVMDAPRAQGIEFKAVASD